MALNHGSGLRRQARCQAVARVAAGECCSAGTDCSSASATSTAAIMAQADRHAAHRTSSGSGRTRAKRSQVADPMAR